MGVWKRVLMVFIVSAFAPQSWAVVACPVTLVDGKADRDGIVLSFRNKGKMPIQQLAFDCALTSSQGVHRTSCHNESGLFYPGTDYTSSFAYRSHAGSIEVFVKNARLADGSFWFSNRDQRCRPLRIVPKRKP
jgi:hypothetical protein